MILNYSEKHTVLLLKIQEVTRLANEQQPKISVILPSLNVKPYIDQCINSVRNQTLKDIEILCIDAGSDDGTLEILKEYAQQDERVHVFLSNKRSYGAQVNQGIHNAKGEYISIIETDDFIKKDMLKSLYDLTQFGYIDLVKSTFYHLYEENGEQKIAIDKAKRNLTYPGTNFVVEDNPLFLEGHPSIWTAIYKRSFLINNDIKFLEEDGGGWVDNPFFYETALKANTIVYKNIPYYYYRESNENSSTNNLKDLSIPIKRINDMFNILDDINCENEEIKEMLHKRLWRYIEIIIENNNNSSNNLDYETVNMMHKVLRRLDHSSVRNLSNKEKQIYYKFVSPLILYQFNN